jgi:two-component system LytT family response regulator
VVFTTAYDSYAVRAFEISAIDYLVKPIASKRLAASLARGRFGDRVAWFKDPDGNVLIHARHDCEIKQSSIVLSMVFRRVTLNPGIWY